jgi:xanthine dehydrogenase accessory factor
MGDELDHVLATARAWLDAGHKVALATVIETWGSAPRRKGSHAIIRDDGLFEGSVSGGCVEGDVIFSAQDLLRQGGGSVRRDYGIADDMAWQVGLACGGEISVFVQTIDDDHFPPAMIGTIAAARAAGQSIGVTTDLATGTSAEQLSSDQLFTNIYPPRLRMMIVGAVHIAQSLAPLAALVGYQPLLVDPRDGFAAASRFADITVDTRWPDEAIAEWRPDSATAVVTLSHDPKIDDPALVLALRSPAFYIAALGSRRTHARRIERLTALGFSESELARIQGPAGLAIGAVNPAEIALSIMAGATAALRLPAG